MLCVEPLVAAVAVASAELGVAADKQLAVAERIAADLVVPVVRLADIVRIGSMVQWLLRRRLVAVWLALLLELVRRICRIRYRSVPCRHCESSEGRCALLAELLAVAPELVVVLAAFVVPAAFVVLAAELAL